VTGGEGPRLSHRNSLKLPGWLDDTATGEHRSNARRDFQCALDFGELPRLHSRVNSVSQNGTRPCLYLRTYPCPRAITLCQAWHRHWASDPSNVHKYVLTWRLDASL